MFIINLLAVILFIIVFFGLCIFVHELGHLLAALWRGLYVERFSVGFGKKLWGIKRNDVEYVVSMLPFGGYVALPQLEPSDEPESRDGEKLPHAEPLDRILTAAAGPVFNLVFGFFLALFIWHYGIDQPAPATSCDVFSVPEDHSEYQAGLRVGDRVIAVNGDGFEGGWAQISERITLHRGQVTLTVQREDGIHEITYDPDPNPAVEGLGYPFFRVRSPTVVRRVISGGSAERSGILAKDVILAVNGKTVEDINDFIHVVRQSLGAPMDITVERDGEKVVIAGVEAEKRAIAEEEVRQIGVLLKAVGTECNVYTVREGSPEQDAGLLPGDRILAVNDQSLVAGATELVDLIGTAAGKPQPDANETDGTVETEPLVRLAVRRNGADVQVAYTPATKPVEDGEGTEIDHGFTVVLPTVIDAVAPDGPASEAGLQQGDTILQIDGQQAGGLLAIAKAISTREDAPLQIRVERDGQPLDIGTVHTVAEPLPVFVIGAELDTPTVLAYPTPWEQFVDVFSRTARTLRSLFARNTLVKPRHMSGPVGIVQMLYLKIRAGGFQEGLSFVILLSFSLAFFNLLPIPVLDGGHIMFALGEAVMRKRVPAKFSHFLQNAFAVMLISLMLYITFYDIKRVSRVASILSDANEELVVPGSTAWR